MVLLSSKTSHMPNGKLVANEAQIGSRLRASLSIEAEAVQINCVVYDLKVRGFTKKPFTGELTACKSVCWIPIRLRFQHGLQAFLAYSPLPLVEWLWAIRTGTPAFFAARSGKTESALM